MGGRNNGHFRDPRIWDIVANMADNDVAAAGFQNSYDGKIISDEEVKQNVENVYIKLESYLSKKETVALEIGCSSGLTMYRISPYCKHYIGTDMASVNLEKNKTKNAERGIENIELVQCTADEIGQFEGRDVNLVIMNSVIQYCENEEYLDRVIETSIRIMENGGVIFIGDIRDEDLKEEFESGVAKYKAEHGIKDKHTKWTDELFLKRSYFDKWLDHPRVSDVKTGDKLGDIMNEFRQYRFDGMIVVKPTQSI